MRRKLGDERIPNGHMPYTSALPLRTNDQLGDWDWNWPLSYGRPYSSAVVTMKEVL